MKEVGESKPVWAGKPSVSVFYSAYGSIAVVLAVMLVGLELWLGMYMPFGHLIIPSKAEIGLEVFYPVELITVAAIFLGFIFKVVELALLRARNTYELHADGLYMNLGIVNLENVYVSPMSFSDARLFRSWSMRLLKRGNILVDTNDQRHFRLRLLENPLEVQAIIRNTLGQPTVRIGKT